MTNIAVENAHRKFVSFPINNMVVFRSYVRHYQRVVSRSFNQSMAMSGT